MPATYIKTTLDGRKVEVIDGWICLAGAREADCLIPMDEQPCRAEVWYGTQSLVPATLELLAKLRRQEPVWFEIGY